VQNCGDNSDEADCGDSNDEQSCVKVKTFVKFKNICIKHIVRLWPSGFYQVTTRFKLYFCSRNFSTSCFYCSKEFFRTITEPLCVCLCAL
jgi:hypothetical protein